MSAEINLNIGTLIGCFIVVISLSVLFGQLYAPIVAVVVGTSVFDAAVLWLILGMTMVISGQHYRIENQR